MPKTTLSEGSITKALLLFSLPMIAGNLLQQAYNLVDTWMVSTFLGPAALGAVGSAFSFMTFVTSILLGLCMGSQVIFSQSKGAGDPVRMKQAIQSSFLLVSGLSILLTAISFLFLEPFIVWMNIPSELHLLFRNYLIWILPGIPFVGMYNFFASILRSQEDSMTPLYVLMISALVNIILDYLLIVCLPLSTAGAAAASLMAQIFSALLIALWTLGKYPQMKEALFTPSWTLKMMKPIFQYSAITCLQQSMMNFGILLIQGLVNSFGAAIMAAFAAGVKIDSLAYMPLQEYGNAFSVFTAQNLGAGKNRRIEKGLKISVLLSTVYALSISALFWLFSGNLMMVFLSPEQTEIILEGVRYLQIEGSFYFAIGILFLFYGYFRAISHPWISVILTVLSLGTRITLSYAFSYRGGVTIIWFSIVIGWILADLAGVIFWKKYPVLPLLKKSDPDGSKQRDLPTPAAAAIFQKFSAAFFASYKEKR